MNDRLRSIARRIVPGPARRLLKRAVGRLDPYRCPVCDNTFDSWQMFYRDIGDGKTRAERPCMCPYCQSFERTRHFWLYLKRHQLLRDLPRLLHVAPEAGLERRLRRLLGDRYVTTDLMRDDVDVRSDLTATSFRDGSFDLIYCSNVLEHVDDDRAAMAELYRILAPGGLAIIQVPIRGETTLEDPSVVDPVERARLFGQADHVRYYGRDIAERLEDSGFLVEEAWMPDALEPTPAMLHRCNIAKRELVQFCRKDRHDV